MSETSPRIEYRGNCHCGAFKFKLRVSELNEALSCNCSICSKNGYLWTFPERDQFTVVKGDESTTLKSYRFGKQAIMHKFCPTCGTSVMQARMPNCTDARIPIMGINIRTLEGVDVDSLKVNAFEGCMAEGAPHKVPEPVATGPVSEGSTAYHGNCHCGAVAYTLLAPQKISKNLLMKQDAALWTYPDTDTITFRGRESATEYTFSSRVAYHGFCKVCGVSVYERFDNSHDPRTALNVRTMHGLDVATLEIRLFDGKAMPPVYSVWEP